MRATLLLADIHILSPLDTLLQGFDNTQKSI